MFHAVNADGSVPSPGSVHSMTFRLQETIDHLHETGYEYERGQTVVRLVTELILTV